MSDLISRQAAIDMCRKPCMRNADCSDFEMEIMMLPSAEPKKIRGKWMPITNGRLGHECDQCHEYAPSYESGNEYLSRFCPNCGADMRGDAE